MSKARDLANAGTALGTVDATELGYLDGVTSAVQTQINAQIPKSTVTTKGDILVATGSATIVRQGVGTDGQVLTANSAQADGIEWTTLTTLPSQTGNSGKFLTTNGTAASWGTAGVNWTQRFGGNGNGTNRIAYNGTNLWVAVSNGGYLLTSPDGITWTARTSQFGSTDIYDVAFGNGLWVAVGGAGKISTSTDGITWTARTSNMSTNDIYSVVYANSLWVAVGTGGGTTNTGGIIYSTDGITWTRKSQSLTVGQSYRCVVWNGTNWVVGATTTTNNHLTATTPDGTWTARATTQGGTITKIFWDGTRHILVEGTSWFFSTSLTVGTTTDYSIGNGYNSTIKREVLYSGIIYFSSNSSPYYIIGFTPQSSANPLGINPIINPTVSYGGDVSNGLWIGAQGIIVGDGQGRIWTSF